MTLPKTIVNFIKKYVPTGTVVTFMVGTIKSKLISTTIFSYKTVRGNVILFMNRHVKYHIFNILKYN